MHPRNGYIASYLEDEIKKINHKTKFKSIKPPEVFPGSDRLVSQKKKRRLLNARVDQTKTQGSTIYASTVGEPRSFERFGHSKHHKTYTLHSIMFKNNIKKAYGFYPQTLSALPRSAREEIYETTNFVLP